LPTLAAGASTTTEAVCQSPATTTAAFDLLVALCTNCPANLSLLARMLADMFYTTERGNSGGAPLTEWEYLPPVGPRPAGGFVGLKNAGATCYMNSVLQQLFMLEGIRQEKQTVCCRCQRAGISAFFAQKRRILCKSFSTGAGNENFTCFITLSIPSYCEHENSFNFNCPRY
jgi:hypothetical protein